MTSKKTPSPLTYAPAVVREPVSISIKVKPIRSLPVLPNGMQAVRDPQTGQVRVLLRTKRPGNRG